VHPGARPHVDDVVGGADGVLVVLDDDHAVAAVAQLVERLDQAVVVALVQPDRRLVEDVEHADQRRADLRGQPDALRLAARQGRRGAVEAEVVEADVHQEAEPIADLAQDAARDLLLPLVQRQRREELVRLLHRQRRHLVDRAVADADEARLLAQPRPAAILAGALVHVAVELVVGRLDPLGREAAARCRLLAPAPLVLGEAPLEVRDHPLELLLECLFYTVLLDGELELGAGGRVTGVTRVARIGRAGEAVEDDPARLRRQRVPRRQHVEAELRRQRLELDLVEGRAAPIPRLDRALSQRQLLVRHDQVLVEEQARADAVAGRAGAVRVVEREQPRLHVGEGDAADRARELL
jgi:hypothetical protein